MRIQEIADIIEENYERNEEGNFAWVDIVDEVASQLDLDWDEELHTIERIAQKVDGLL